MKKIKVKGSAQPKVKQSMVAAGLGAKIVDIPEISKEEAEQYKVLGSPVMLPSAEKLCVYYFGSRMLGMYGKSIDEVVGYRVVDTNEEEGLKQFRQQCRDYLSPVVCYYAKK